MKDGIPPNYVLPMHEMVSISQSDAKGNRIFYAKKRDNETKENNLLLFRIFLNFYLHFTLV